MDSHSWASASDIAASVTRGEMSALAIVEHALAAIRTHNPTLNAFTHVTEERAIARATIVGENVPLYAHGATTIRIARWSNPQTRLLRIMPRTYRQDMPICAFALFYLGLRIHLNCVRIFDLQV